MFTSLRVALSGLEKDSHYCVVLEMAPVSDCRFKFSGTQWVPAGGAEPQSTQRIYIHPDSPALGSHWQAQPIIFNKVKLTNNSLDSNGHVSIQTFDFLNLMLNANPKPINANSQFHSQMILASMHKYQPRLHIIRTSEPSQIPWAPQQSFTFPETEFVAVTAYQVSSITIILLPLRRYRPFPIFFCGLHFAASDASILFEFFVILFSSFSCRLYARHAFTHAHNHTHTYTYTFKRIRKTNIEPFSSNSVRNFFLSKFD